MSEINILKKYAAPARILEPPKTDNVLQVYKTIMQTIVIENQYYKMQVYYGENERIQMIKVNNGIAETLLALANISNGFISFTYAVPETSDLGQRGVELLQVSSDCKESIDLQQFCESHPKIKRHPKLISGIIDLIGNSNIPNKTELSISTDLSLNEKYLREQGLYDELSDAIRLFQALSAKCLGKTLKLIELRNLMEKGDILSERMIAKSNNEMPVIEKTSTFRIPRLGSKSKERQ